MSQILIGVLSQKWGPLFGIFLLVAIGDSAAGALAARRIKLDDPGQANKRIEREKALIKRAGVLLLIGCAFLADALVEQMTTALGWDMDLTVLGGLTLVWLIVHDLLSILEHLQKMGVPIPESLYKLLKECKKIIHIKSKKGG